MKKSCYVCDICSEEMYGKPRNAIRWRYNKPIWWDWDSGTMHLCDECVDKFKEFVKSYDLPQREQDN